MTTPTPDAFDNNDDTELADSGCLWCVDGFAPAGTHPVLGAVYVACPGCVPICPCCDGAGLFSADTTCPHCLVAALATVGCVAAFCHTCFGVLAVHPTTEVTT
jgi:hypothetical protein